MKEQIEQLIEDYKRRLATVENMSISLSLQGATNTDQWQKLGTKASCYRTFITELERLAKD
ncbi:hypothetical protein [Pontibacter beigongshangensis]|uniref:hypothetical protein n=1 Tax=Pontibacter beigongshangensis TaxID=2574733 RepID=UPI001650C110|nr:hypothetical protein [Pontibacter beigongshangensis]